jgi:alkylhydroperoxidase family enzyme
MARISFPEQGFGEHVDWALQRPEMAVGMGKLSSAVYGNTRLPVREREAARYTIALINECLVCKDTRAEKGPEAGIDDGFYAEVSSWRTSEVLTPRERLAAEFAERFALDHHTMDDAFFDRMRGAQRPAADGAKSGDDGYTDEELADLTLCCGMFLGLGRMLAVVGVPAPDERILV